MDIDPYILFGGIGAIVLIVAGLFYKGKLTSFTFEKSKDTTKVELKTDAPQANQIYPSDALPARDTIKNQGDLHVHNYGVDVGTYRQILQEELHEVKKEFGSGKKIDQENLIFKKQIGDLEDKLNEVEKNLADREMMLAEAQSALESVELKNIVPEDQLAKAKKKLKQGDSSDAEAILTKVLEETETQALSGAEAAYRLGNLAFERPDYRTVRKFYDRAVQLAPGNSLYLNQAGVVADTLADYDKAIEYFEQGASCDIKTLGPEHPEVAASWNNLGEAWRAKGQYDKAIEYYEKALTLVLKTFDSEHPKVAILWGNLGIALRSKGNYDKAIEYHQKALDSHLKTVGSSHPYAAIGWNNLGMAWHDKGDYDKAITYYEKAYASNLKTIGPENSDIAINLNNLGEAWRDKGNYDKAISYYEKALVADLKIFNPDHPDVARVWNNLGLAWNSKAEYDKAIEYFEKAQEVNLKILGQEHPNVAAGWNNLGSVSKAKEDFDKAIEYFEKALAVYEELNLPHRVKLVKENIADLKNQR